MIYGILMISHKKSVYIQFSDTLKIAVFTVSKS